MNNQIPRRSFFGTLLAVAAMPFGFLKEKPARQEALVLPIKANWKEFDTLLADVERERLTHSAKHFKEVWEFHQPLDPSLKCDLITADGSDTFHKRFGPDARIFVVGQQVQCRAYAMCLTCGWVGCYIKHKASLVENLWGPITITDPTGKRLFFGPAEE